MGSVSRPVLAHSPVEEERTIRLLRHQLQQLEQDNVAKQNKLREEVEVKGKQADVLEDIYLQLKEEHEKLKEENHENDVRSSLVSWS